MVAVYKVSPDLAYIESCTILWSKPLILLPAGVKVLFRVSLVLFKYALGRPEQLVECPTLYEIMEQLRHLPPECLQEEVLCHEVCAVKELLSKEYQLGGFKGRGWSRIVLELILGVSLISFGPYVTLHLTGVNLQRTLSECKNANTL